jgi:hypothetical protein
MQRRDLSRRAGACRGDARDERCSPRVLRWRAAGALLLALMSSSGCYHYVPVSPGAVSSDEEVRVLITSSAAERLSDALGVYSTEIDGKLSARGPDSLTVAVPIERKYRGIALDSTLQSLTLGRSEVVDVRRSELSRGRTILTSAGVLAGFALLVHAVVQLTNPNPGTDVTLPPPPPLGARAPSGHTGHTLGIRIPFP